MGQRLNIEIKLNNKLLANCYYHWSGYTTSSLKLTKQIIEYLKNNNVSYDIKGAIELLNCTGASFNKQSWENAKKEGLVYGNYEKVADRNNGLIGVSEIDIKETRSWEEGRIEINIENKTFKFDCVSEKDYIDDSEIWYRVSDLFYKINLDKVSKYEIPFYQIDTLLNGVVEAENNYKGRFYFSNYCFDSIY
jgi:hypothetical protein